MISFKNKFEGIARARGWNDKTKTLALYSAIQNEAANALGEADSINWSYDRLVAHMERRHGRNKTWGDVLPQARTLSLSLNVSVHAINETVDYMQSITDTRFDQFDRRVRQMEGRPMREEEFAQKGFAIPASKRFIKRTRVSM